MATLEELAARLRLANPENRPMFLPFMAQHCFPDAAWLKSKPNRHNGGARTGARVAGAFAGRMEKRGLLRMVGGDGPRAYVWKEAGNG